MKKITLIFLVATFSFQWFVPLNMIVQQETILKEGTTFKFITKPVDPNDPFRGKYIVLNFKADRFEDHNDQDWSSGETVFVKIQNNADGFAEIADVEKVAPKGEKHYIKAEVYSVWGQNPILVHLKYPFGRFYMEESKAPKAEAMFRDLWQDSSTTTYALVVINEGKAALEDVLVNDISIREAVINNE